MYPIPKDYEYLLHSDETNEYRALLQEARAKGDVDAEIEILEALDQIKNEPAQRAKTLGLSTIDNLFFNTPRYVESKIRGVPRDQVDQERADLEKRYPNEAILGQMLGIGGSFLAPEVTLIPQATKGLNAVGRFLKSGKFAKGAEIAKDAVGYKDIAKEALKAAPSNAIAGAALSNLSEAGKSNYDWKDSTLIGAGIGAGATLAGSAIEAGAKGTKDLAKLFARSATGMTPEELQILLNKGTGAGKVFADLRRNNPEGYLEYIRKVSGSFEKLPDNKKVEVYLALRNKLPDTVGAKNSATDVIKNLTPEEYKFALKDINETMSLLKQRKDNPIEFNRVLNEKLGDIDALPQEAQQRILSYQGKSYDPGKVIPAEPAQYGVSEYEKELSRLSPEQKQLLEIDLSKRPDALEILNDPSKFKEYINSKISSIPDERLPQYQEALGLETQLSPRQKKIQEMQMTEVGRRQLAAYESLPEQAKQEYLAILDNPYSNYTDIGNMLSGVKSDLYNQVTVPAQDRIKNFLDGSSLTVYPKQYEGTGVYADIASASGAIFDPASKKWINVPESAAIPANVANQTRQELGRLSGIKSKSVLSPLDYQMKEKEDALRRSLRSDLGELKPEINPEFEQMSKAARASNFVSANDSNVAKFIDAPMTSSSSQPYRAFGQYADETLGTDILGRQKRLEASKALDLPDVAEQPNVRKSLEDRLMGTGNTLPQSQKDKLIRQSLAKDTGVDLDQMFNEKASYETAEELQKRLASLNREKPILKPEIPEQVIPGVRSSQQLGNITDELVSVNPINRVSKDAFRREIDQAAGTDFEKTAYQLSGGNKIFGQNPVEDMVSTLGQEDAQKVMSNINNPLAGLGERLLDNNMNRSTIRAVQNIVDQGAQEAGFAIPQLEGSGLGNLSLRDTSLLSNAGQKLFTPADLTKNPMPYGFGFIPGSVARPVVREGIDLSRKLSSFELPERLKLNVPKVLGTGYNYNYE